MAVMKKNNSLTQSRNVKQFPFSSVSSIIYLKYVPSFLFHCPHMQPLSHSSLHMWWSILSIDFPACHSIYHTFCLFLTILLLTPNPVHQQPPQSTPSSFHLPLHSRTTKYELCHSWCTPRVWVCVPVCVCTCVRLHYVCERSLLCAFCSSALTGPLTMFPLYAHDTQNTHVQTWSDTHYVGRGGVRCGDEGGGGGGDNEPGLRHCLPPWLPAS